MPEADPNLFALPPGVDFAAAVLDGLAARLAAGSSLVSKYPGGVAGPAGDGGWPPALADPLALSRIRIFVNTERARRRMQALLLERAVHLPPRIHVLADLARDLPDLPPPLPPLRRRLELARLVRALIEAAPDLGAKTAAWDMADSLAALLGELQMEGLGIGALTGLEAPDAAGHWQRSLTFLRLIRDVLEGDGALDAEARLRLAIERLAADWAENPPRDPVLVAGSTGSRGAVAEFMALVAGLPDGAVILPGLDTALEAADWAELSDGAHTADHPQFGLAALCAKLGLAPESLPRWTDAEPPAPARNRLLSLALRPAPVTDQWLARGPALRPDLAEAMAGVALVEAAGPHEEAQAIAIALRRAAETGQKAALVTPDRALARRVTAALDRWRIIPDDSAGVPLDLTPPGTFLRLVATALCLPLTPVTALALLKHPLCGGEGATRRAHLRHVARLETGFLRGGAGYHVTPEGLRHWAQDDKHADSAPWALWLAELLEPIAGTPPLPDLVAGHLRRAEALAAGHAGDGSGQLWEAKAGEAARRTTDSLAAQADSGGALPAPEYPALLRKILGREDVPEEGYQPHPGIAIWGPLEARTQTAEVLILGGLNEGTWPRLPSPDPWLGRDMRGEIGLPLPERRIGLSAHDFQQGAAAREVILTRSVNDGAAPTVPARWLLRLTNLLGGLPPEGPAALKAMQARGAALLALARRLDAAPERPRAVRPGPVPPARAFPDRLSVTQVETLVRDPYAVYARQILRLRKLDPLGREPDARERGTLSHAVLERFVERTQDGLPDDPATLFRETCAEVLVETIPWPAARAMWAARLEALADWFLAGEAERRRIASPALREAGGECAVDGLAAPFRLYARADRIDLGPHGAAIYDYKGSIGSKPKTHDYAKQVPLEAGMLLRGAFDGAAADRIAALQILGLGGGGQTLDYDPASVPDTWEELRTLIAAYQAGGRAFPPRARPDLCFDEGDYDHLSRRGEWLDGDAYTEEPLE